MYNIYIIYMLYTYILYKLLLCIYLRFECLEVILLALLYMCPHTDINALTNIYKHILLPHTDMCPQ